VRSRIICSLILAVVLPLGVAYSQETPRGPVDARSLPFDAAHVARGPAVQSVDAAESDPIAAASRLPGSLKLLLTMSVLSLAPALLMMTTCFVRFTIVTSLLRQAIGVPNLPPNQVLTGLCLFLTLLVMAPVWEQAYQQGIEPYLNQNETSPTLTETDAFRRTMAPMREFMGGQIEQSGNQDAVWMLYAYQQGVDPAELSESELPQNYQEVPLSVLLPAYLISELKTAFLIGFQIFLPFLVIDLVVSSVLAGTGMVMLPPVLVSMPFKLLLFVLIDGWYLIVGMMLESVRPLG
jgi:flagellar biosynthetic protein FliP